MSAVGWFVDKLDFKTLKDKQHDLQDGFPDDLRLRVHRAISWGLRAEKEAEDADVRFLLLWIGFNAAYARIPAAFAEGEKAPSEWQVFQGYFQALVDIDEEGRIFSVVWERFFRKDSSTFGWVRNKYVFAPFWEHVHGKPGRERWNSRLAASAREFNRARKEKDTVLLLTKVFDSLYTLRNQLMHGGATWDSKVNREQVNDGAEIMSWMLPIFVDLMMENSDKLWGKPFYPVIEK